jgi:hypothetical protein
MAASSSTAAEVLLESSWTWYYDAPPRNATAKQYDKSVKNLGTFNSVQVRALVSESGYRVRV